MLRFKEDIFEILSIARADARKKVRQAGAKVLKEVLWSVCSMYPLDFRSLPPSEWNSPATKHWLMWGTTSSEVACAWHEPTKEELSFAAELGNTFLDESFNSLRKLMKREAPTRTTDVRENDETTIPDLIFASLDVIRSVLYGAGDSLPKIVELDSQLAPLGEDGRFIHRRLKVSASGLTMERNARRESAEMAHTVLAHLITSKDNTVKSQQVLCKIMSLAIGDFTGDSYLGYRSMYRRLKRKWKSSILEDQNPRYFAIERLCLHHILRVYYSRMELTTMKDPLCSALMSDLLELTTGAYDSLGDQASDVLANCIDRLREPPDELALSALKKLREPSSTANGEGATLGASVLLLGSTKLKVPLGQPLSNDLVLYY